MARDPEKYSRESFSLRGMRGWQRWGITLVAVVVVVVAIGYAVA